ncbi:MAG: class I SAM-dependent methyltransferase [Phycisphaerae bacterium]|nr:class I SAM-dependent methyltransferase [Phycisphaerae bacterium]
MPAPDSFDALSHRLDALERLAAGRAPTPASAPGDAPNHAAWRGGADGSALTPDARADDRLTRKLRGELSFWLDDAGAPASDKRREFDERWTFYQRQRLGELAWTLQLESAAALAGWVRPRSVVEVGGGPFPGVSLLRAARAIAVDPLADAYVSADLVPARAGHVVHVGAPAERIPLAQGCADLVICENCLDHVEDPTLATREMSRLLVPGGLFWLLVDLMEFRDELHPNPMNHARLAAILRDAGLGVLYQATWDGASHPEAARQTRLLAWKPGGEKPGVRVEPGRIADSSLIGAG